MARVLFSAGKGFVWTVAIGVTAWFLSLLIVSAWLECRPGVNEDELRQPPRSPRFDPKRWQTGKRLPDDVLDGSRGVRIESPTGVSVYPPTVR